MPSIFFEPTFHLLAGHAFGVQQPTLLVRIDVDARPVPRPETADGLLAELLDEPELGPDLPSAGPEALLARLMQALILVQRGQKIPVFGSGRIIRLEPVDGQGRFRAALAVPCWRPEAARLALGWGVQAIDALLAPQPDPQAREQVSSTLQACQQKLRAYAVQGINTMHFLQAAFDAGIPNRAISPEIHGFGVAARMRWLKSSITDASGSIAVALAHRKRQTASILRQHGIPTPRHEVAGTLAQALEAAGRIGFPVVVKPDDQEQGRGVSAGLTTPQAVEAAFELARAHSKNLLVEKHHHGQDYRLTVFHGQVVKVLQRSAGAVVGDSVRSIAELVEIEQQTPRHRRLLRQSGRRLLELDAEALGLLAESGYGADHIPLAGERVALRRKSNISAGGTQALVSLQQIHPDNLDLAIRACEAIRLDLCGVDLLIPDIAKSWLETGAVVIELNAQPQIGISLDPGAYARILEGLGEGRWTIPLQLVVCESADTAPGPDQLAALCGPATGVATPAGVWIAGRRVVAKPANGFEACRTLLLQRAVDSAVCCMTADEVRQLGLPAAHFDRIVLLPAAVPGEPAPSRWTRVRAIAREHAATLTVATAP